MVQFAVYGKVRQGTQDEFAAAVREFMGSVSKEPGTKQYYFCQGKDDPTSFIFFEGYEDQAAADAHGSSAQIKAFFSRVMPMVEVGPIAHPVVAAATD